MSQSISWTLNIAVAGGPTMSNSRSLGVEAYDSIKVSVRGSSAPGGPDTDKQVEVQPGGSGQVTFLAVTSNRYDAHLTYKVNATGNPAVEIDQPQVLAGAGAVGLLGAAPNTLYFSSTLSENAEIQILVGRDATP